MRHSLPWWALLWVGCAAQEGTPSPTPGQPAVTPTPAPSDEVLAEALSPREALIRVSLDLRGIRPTEAEYAAVEQDPAALTTLVETFYSDPRFGGRIRELFAPIFRTRVDQFPVSATQYGLSEEQNAAFQAAVGDETLYMVSHLAVSDKAWTELVTGNWTMANELLGKAWPVDYPQGETGWKRVAYTDGRPGAGILSTNSLWWRYPSNGANYNRGRANALADILLCSSYLTRPVTFDNTVDLSDPEQVKNALRTNQSCVACHQSLDPLASYLFGFTYVSKNDPKDASFYHPERERDWESATGSAPTYFGSPGYTLRDLGQQVAGDPRYVSCVVERVWESLLGRASTDADLAALASHREHFLAGGLTLRSLLKSVVQDVGYLGTPDQRQGLPRKLVSPEIFASQVEDLTGYRFTVGGADQLRVDQGGLRGLAGGGDGNTGAGAADIPTPSMMLVYERIAQAAALWVVEQDMVAADPRLFPALTFTETPQTDRAAMVAQLQHLHRRLFGIQVAPDGGEVEAGLSLWSALYGADPNHARAWAGVLSVLLRDPDFIFY